MKYNFIMKFRVVLLFLVAAITLSACADVDISYKLSNDNSLNINYLIKLSPEGKDLSGNISLIKEYWTDLGFTAEDSENNGVFTLKGEKSIEYDSRGSAVKEFSSVLTDEGSLFFDVKLAYTPSYFEDVYDLTATVSLQDIIRKSEESCMPSTEIESFIAGAENSIYKLSMMLPGEVQETNADEQNEQTCTWLLKYGEERQLKLVTKRVFDDKVAHYAGLNETKSRDNLLFMVGCGAAGFLLILIIIITSVRRARRTRRSEINVERF